MHKLVKNTLALFIAGSMTIGLAETVNAEGERMVQTPSELSIIVPTNDNEDFPFDICLEYNDSSLHYSSSERSSLGTEKLKEAEIEYKISISSKDKADYEFCLYWDKTSRILNNTSKNILTSSEVLINKVYEFDATHNSKSYTGKLAVTTNEYDKLYVDIIYSEVVDDSQPRNISMETESEPNNSYSNANTIESCKTMMGKLSSTSDVDYYYLEVPLDISYGYLDITLAVPNGYNYDIQLYSGVSPHYYLAYSNKPTGADEFIRFNNCNSTSGYSGFYIKVINSGTTSGANYYLNVNNINNYPFYSQKASKISNISFWNDEYLDSLTFSNANNPSRCFYSSSTSDYDWMREGCFISSIAMMLRKKNLTMDGKDYRTGYDGDMFADPFTVMLANNNLDGRTLTDRTEEQTLPSNSSSGPCFVSTTIIGNNFDCTYTSVDLANKTEDFKRTKIDNYINQYGAAIVKLINGDHSHFIIFYGYKSSETDINKRYYVLDPYASNLSGAEGVLFNGCATFSSSPVYDTYTYNKNNIKGVGAFY